MDVKKAEALLKQRGEEIIKNNMITLNILGLPKEKTLSYKYNLTPQQSDVMSLLYYGGPKQISEVAWYTRLIMPNATKLSNIMVEKGLCQKIKEAGKRAVFLGLTELGRTAFEENLHESAVLLAHVFSKCLTDEEQEEYYNHYKRLNELSLRLLWGNNR